MKLTHKFESHYITLTGQRKPVDCYYHLTVDDYNNYCIEFYQWMEQERGVYDWSLQKEYVFTPEETSAIIELLTKANKLAHWL